MKEYMHPEKNVKHYPISASYNLCEKLSHTGTVECLREAGHTGMHEAHGGVYSYGMWYTNSDEL